MRDLARRLARCIPPALRSLAVEVAWFHEDLWEWLVEGTRVHYHQHRSPRT